MDLTEEEVALLMSILEGTPAPQVDLRRQEGESVEAYRARVQAAQGTVPTPPGSREMDALALSSMQPVPPPPPSMAEDIIRSGLSGIGRGVTAIAGAPGSLDNLIRNGLERVGIMPTAEDMIAQGLDPQVAAQTARSPLGIAGITGAVDDATGGALSYDPQTTAGEYAGTVGEFLPGGALVGSLLKFGLIPGMASEAAGQATEDTALEPWARLAAAVAAPVAAQAVSHPSSILRALYGSADPDPVRAGMAQTLDDAGIRMTAGQRVGDETILRREMMTGTGQRLIDDQAEAFTRAALATTGEVADRALPAVLASARTRIGSVFDDVQSGVDITPDASMTAALRQVADDYADSVATQVPAIRNITTAVEDAATAGTTIPASELTRWRRVVNNLVTSQDDATREAARAVKEMLDDALETQLGNLGRFDDVARLAEARTQYRNLLAIIRASTGAGSDTAMGLLSPSMLRSSVAAQDRTAYATGTRGDIAELARAGESVLRRPPNSGTPGGILAQGIPQTLSTGVGAYLGAQLGPVASTVGAVGGLLAPMAYRAGLMTGPVQRAIVNGGPRLIPKELPAGLLGLLAE
jgi:hypothetical protein